MASTIANSSAASAEPSLLSARSCARRISGACRASASDVNSAPSPFALRAFAKRAPAREVSSRCLADQCCPCGAPTSNRQKLSWFAARGHGGHAGCAGELGVTRLIARHHLRAWPHHNAKALPSDRNQAHAALWHGNKPPAGTVYSAQRKGRMRRPQGTSASPFCRRCSRPTGCFFLRSDKACSCRRPR
jgi:hypothetical protein